MLANCSNPRNICVTDEKQNRLVSVENGAAHNKKVKNEKSTDELNMCLGSDIYSLSL